MAAAKKKKSTKKPATQTNIPGTRPAYMDEIEELCSSHQGLKDERKAAKKAEDAALELVAAKCLEHKLHKFKFAIPGAKVKLYTDEAENSWRCRQAGKED